MKTKRFWILFLIFSFYSNSGHLAAEQELLFPDPEATISIDFQDARLKDILKIFSIQSGLNFIASEAVQERNLTLYLDKVSVKEAMDKIFKANNLTYELERGANIFIVKDWGKPQIETVTKVFYLKYATVSSSSLKEEMAKQITQTEGGAGGGGGSSGKWKVEEDTGITVTVKKLLSEYGSVVEDFRTNSLIVTDIPSRMPIITQAIAALDVPVPQVILEVEMLDVSKNVVDKLGVNWPSTLAQLTVPGSRVTRFPFGDKGTSGEGYTIDPDEGVFGGPGGGWDVPVWDATHFGPSIFTIIGTTLTLDFLRTQADTKYLARPRLLTLNNEPAEIRIATNEAIGVKVTTTYSEGTGQTTNEAERTETGVVLRVTPQVNLETGEITMFIYPKVADAILGSEFIIAGSSYQYRNPEERSTKSVVRVKDGETVIIGGLIRNESDETIIKLPILGDIPLLGTFFRHRNKDKDKERELLVFITPRIVKEIQVGVASNQRSALPLSPAREQNTVSGIDRRAIVNSSLNNFERRLK